MCSDKLTREEELELITHQTIRKYEIKTFDEYAYWMMDQDVYFEILELMGAEGHLTEDEYEKMQYGEMPNWVNEVWNQFETEMFGDTCG